MHRSDTALSNLSFASRSRRIKRGSKDSALHLVTDKNANFLLSSVSSSISFSPSFFRVRRFFIRQNRHAFEAFVKFTDKNRALKIRINIKHRLKRHKIT